MDSASDDLLVNKRVLVVEDDALVGIGLLTCLEDIGAEVLWTSTVDSAIAAIEGAVPMHLAIVDINLNGVKSNPVLDVLIDRNVPVLLCTGYDPSFIDGQYRHLSCVAKPFTRNKVIPIVSELMAVNTGASQIGSLGH